MKVTLRRSDDVQTAYALHLILFPEDEWEDETLGNVYWIAKDSTGTPVGFCAARWSSFDGWVFLSRAGVLPCARGHKLQRRMIRVRERWARSVGATGVLTYVHKDNHASLSNLMKCNYRLYHPAEKEADFLFLCKRFTQGQAE